MATAPAVAYLGDTNEYIDWCSKWSAPYFHRVATFQGGVIGEKCQRKDYLGTDGFDDNAGGSTYTDEVLFQGRQVCKMHAPIGKLGSNAFGGSFNSDIYLRRGQECWSQATLYLPSDKWDLEEVMAGGGGWKLMRQRVTNDNYSVGHTDIYFNAFERDPIHPLYFNREAHTSSSNGHSPHNGIANIGDRSVWDVPRDQWFDIQYYAKHDIDQNGTNERTRLMAWHGDTLIADINAEGNNLRSYTMISDDDYVNITRLCTYINVKNSSPPEPDDGVTKPQTWYCAAYETTSKRPSYTDEFGNPKLPPRVI